EGADFCSDGGMFCLEPAAPSVRFGANLDAIARSGLRVHPMVLRIARGTPGAAR
uniref:YfiR family protein n=1 Tax=Variovorax sp. YR752 TaxID=1884383 RepID=UPI003137AACB